MKEKIFDVVIIGGGITGIGLFRDLSLHGISTAIIDRGNFCAETSAHSSKMLHGGIRYLETMDFELVFEALREKNHWLKLLPQYTNKAKFHIPIYENSPHNFMMTSIGTFLYGILASGSDPIYLPISASKTCKLFPEIKKEGLKGTARYEDAYMDDYAIGLVNLKNALSYGNSNKALDHENVTGISQFREESKDIYHIELESQKKIKAKHIVFCTGPFTDSLMKRLQIPWKQCLRPSRGSHLWLKRSSLTLPHPMVMQDKSGRVIFLMPRDEKILLGTTEIPVDSERIDLEKEITSQEESYLLDCLSHYFPKSKILPSDIIGKYSGIRPLVVDLNEDQDPATQLEVGKVSRHHKIFEPLQNLFIIVGGKYTTFRVMTQEIAKTICQREGRPYSKNKTLQTFF